MILVYAYVVADVLHTGHLVHLINAKGLGDKLIVGVLSDKAAVEKKPLPVMPFSARLELVRSLECVDAAVVQEDYSPLKNVAAIKPDILVESTSHKVKPANAYVKEYGGRVVVMPYYPEVSSTKIKEEICEAQQTAGST